MSNKMIKKPWKSMVMTLVMSVALLSTNFAWAALGAGDIFDESVAGKSAGFQEIYAGEFLMGSPAAQVSIDDDELQHKVLISQDFEMQVTEVTQLQWFLVMGYIHEDRNLGCNGSNKVRIYGKTICKNHPVTHVNWSEAQSFVDTLNEDQDKFTYSLPTEAQWEYAARAGTNSNFPYYFGYNYEHDDGTWELQRHAWYGCTDNTHEVGQKRANPNGLHDVYGNVWEWTQGWYGKSYGLSSSQITSRLTTSVVDPVGPTTGSYRVARGGSWGNNFARRLWSAYRGYASGNRASYIGFRLVRTSR